MSFIATDGIKKRRKRAGPTRPGHASFPRQLIRTAAVRPSRGRPARDTRVLSRAAPSGKVRFGS